MTRLPRPALCLVTDGRGRPGDGLAAASVTALVAWIEDAIRGGLDVIQIREPDLDGATLLALTRRVIAIARPVGGIVLVNDRADVALAAGADGVHLRSDGPPVDRVRAIGPDGWIVGRSIHHADEARRHADADYLLFGTVYPSQSKPSAALVQGTEAIRAVVAETTTPVWVIGGIDAGNAAACVRAGAAGVAAISALRPTTDLGEAAVAVRAMRQAVAGVFDNLLE